MGAIQTVREYYHLASGQSFWRVMLNTSTKVYSELDGVDWRDDLVSTGDTAHIQEVCLCTPVGEAHLLISRPYSAFKFNRGVMLPLGGGRIAEAQVIGRVEDESGLCTCCIWDVLEKRLYTDFATSIYDFAPWRSGITRIGRIAYEAMGVQL